MKKKYLIIIVLLLLLGCSSQKKYNYSVSNNKKKTMIRTQEEQEKLWAQNIFKNNYKKTEYDKFNGVITKKDSLFQFIGIDSLTYFEKYSVFQFGEKQSIVFIDENSDYQLIFEKGLLHPAIFGLEKVKVGYIKELCFLSNNPKIKRFSFQEYCQEPYSVHCSRICYFELTNETATKKTNWNSFLENAKLTFLKAGSIII